MTSLLVFIARVVYITNRNAARIFAAPEFLAKSSFGIFRKRIDIIFALAEGNIQHEFPLRRRLKPKGGEAQGGNLAGIDKIDDLAAINAIAGQAVGMPSNDALRPPFLYLLDHLVEDRPSRNLSRLFFNEGFGNGQAFALGKIAKLGDLRFNG